MRDRELKQVDRDILFFFLALVTSFVAFYIILEKKKSILKISKQDASKINKLYQWNRVLIVIVCLYFLFNAWYSLVKEENNDRIFQDKVFIFASLLSTISALCYLPFGNSNVIIRQ